MLKTNIFVLNYNKTDVTLACLDSIIPQITPNITVVVIDDGSPSPFKFPKKGYKGIKLLRLEQNISLFDAFYAGVKEYPADLYCWSNNDVTIFDGSIAYTISAFENDLSLGIAAGGTNDSGAGVMYTNPPFSLPNVATNHVDNCVFWVRQALIDKIGLVDVSQHKSIMNWCVNRAWCYKARTNGYKVMALRQGSYYQHAHMGGQNQAEEDMGREWLRTMYPGEWSQML